MIAQLLVELLLLGLELAQDRLFVFGRQLGRDGVLRAPQDEWPQRTGKQGDDLGRRPRAVRPVLDRLTQASVVSKTAWEVTSSRGGRFIRKGLPNRAPFCGR